MTFKDGTVYRFGADGKLRSQADLNGHQVVLTYGGDWVTQELMARPGR